jgi:hypothetical protein
MCNARALLVCRRHRWQQLQFVYLRAQAHHLLAVCFEAWKSRGLAAGHLTITPPVMTTSSVLQVLKEIDADTKLEGPWDERVMRRLLLDPPPSDFVIAKSLRERSAAPVIHKSVAAAASAHSLPPPVPPALSKSRRASDVMADSFRQAAQVVIGDSPLHAAADDGNFLEVRRLLREGWNPNALNLRNQVLNECTWAAAMHRGIRCMLRASQTPLHLAARHYSDVFLPIVGALVECGASISVKDRDGNTPSQVGTLSLARSCTAGYLSFYPMVSLNFSSVVVTSACARRPGTAARVERRRHEH